jgi:hypothetical protein
MIGARYEKGETMDYRRWLSALLLLAGVARAQRLAPVQGNDTTLPDPAQAAIDRLQWDQIPQEDVGAPEQHVYLHYDYMYVPGPNGHSHAPSRAALQMVVEAFKRHHVVLHIDPQPNAIPEIPVISLHTDYPYIVPGAVDLYTLKQTWYPKSKHRFEHYVVFGHYAECATDVQCAQVGLPYGISGLAELPGYYFMVTFGFFADYGIPVPDVVNAGTLMHELGHNLGLHHGGDDDLVQKPNYVSVMNYSYQFGIGVTAVPAATGQQAFTLDPTVPWVTPQDLIIDYSDTVLPPLNEGRRSGNDCADNGLPGMDESAGLPGASPSDILVFYDQSGSGIVYFRSGAGTPVDWNADGVMEQSAFGDVSGDGVCSYLHGYDDWSAVHTHLATQR